MPQYSYEASTKQGAVRKGKMDAADEEAVTAALREIGVYPTSIKLYEENAFNIDIFQYRKVTLKDIYIFSREFSYIIAAGMGIVRALDILQEQTENPRLKKVISFVTDRVQKGESLSSSMKNYSEFPDMLVNMIEVGEASGTLDEMMLRMATYYDKEYKQRQKIKQALTYPILVAVMAVVIVNVLVIKVLPTFINMSLENGITKDQLPLPTRIVMGFSDILTGYWYVALILIIFAYVLAKLYGKNKKNVNLDKFKLKFPLLGKLYKKIITARFARTFGMLTSYGIPIIQSMEICSEIVGNTFIRDILLSTKGEIEKGASLGETLESRDIFPVMLIQMIKIGEESGTMDSVLGKTAEFYDGEVETTTVQLTTMIEPLIIAVLGVVVGFIIIAIITPMYQMYNSIN
ncbi:type II secretion system F family protein [Clostridium akagii]|uniref:type II secretion system F family protein n=1 Tax=Clostridium akagii TaxID=91623 RepID=UPI0004789864|nr:type II secretion system F family protein [Clostridium akagii]